MRLLSLSKRGQKLLQVAMTGPTLTDSATLMVGGGEKGDVNKKIRGNTAVAEQS
jgi:hypothetical protein